MTRFISKACSSHESSNFWSIGYRSHYLRATRSWKASPCTRSGLVNPGDESWVVSWRTHARWYRMVNSSSSLRRSKWGVKSGVLRNHKRSGGLGCCFLGPAAAAVRCRYVVREVWCDTLVEGGNLQNRWVSNTKGHWKQLMSYSEKLLQI